jgi:hypothetical protein
MISMTKNLNIIMPDVVYQKLCKMKGEGITWAEFMTAVALSDWKIEVTYEPETPVEE